MGEIDRALPGHDTKDVEREQDPGGMELGVSLLEKAGDNIGTLRATRRGLGCHRAGALLHLWSRAGFSLSAVASGNRNQAGGIRAYGRCGLSYRSFRQAGLEDEGRIFLVAFGG